MVSNVKESPNLYIYVAKSVTFNQLAIHVSHPNPCNHLNLNPIITRDEQCYEVVSNMTQLVRKFKKSSYEITTETINNKTKIH